MTPAYGGNISVNYHNSFSDLLALSKEIQFSQRQAGEPEFTFESTNLYNESLISRGRNRMADSYLKESTATHSIFIDADIGFEPTDVFVMLGLDKPILGVPCSRKSINWVRIQRAIVQRVIAWAHGNTECQNGKDPAALYELFRQAGGEFQPTDLPRIGGDFVMNLKDFEPGQTDRTLQMDSPEEMKHVGTGMLMVKREVYLKFMKAYPNRWYVSKDPSYNQGKIHDFFKVGVNQESRQYDSEDYWFVRDCAELGYKVLLLPYVKTTHMGTFSFTGDMPFANAAAGTVF